MDTHESYVSPETAKMLKQAEFDWEVYRCYETLPEKKKIFGRHLVPYQGKAREDVLPAPTLAVAQRWLREVRNFDVLVLFQWFGDRTVGYKYEIRREGRSYALEKNLPIHKTYESALEAGINKCLTILLEEKK